MPECRLRLPLGIAPFQRNEIVANMSPELAAFFREKYFRFEVHASSSDRHANRNYYQNHLIRNHHLSLYFNLDILLYILF